MGGRNHITCQKILNILINTTLLNIQGSNNPIFKLKDITFINQFYSCEFQKFINVSNSLQRRIYKTHLVKGSHSGWGGIITIPPILPIKFSSDEKIFCRCIVVKGNSSKEVLSKKECFHKLRVRTIEFWPNGRYFSEIKDKSKIPI